jgi:hypothetical protein
VADDLQPSILMERAGKVSTLALKLDVEKEDKAVNFLWEMFPILDQDNGEEFEPFSENLAQVFDVLEKGRN